MFSALSVWVWMYAVGVCIGVSLKTPPPMASRSIVSVRYEGGHLAELRVAQEAPSGANGDADTLSDRRRSCVELCHAGLGGQPCGGILCDNLLSKDFRDIQESSSKASKALPEKQKIKIKFPHHNQDLEVQNNTAGASKNGSGSITIGRPRIEVCPVLCDNNLGQPICGCRVKNVTVDWPSVCDAFCRSNAYQLSGCPPCQIELMDLEMDAVTSSAEYSNMQEFWIEWCHYQCKKGDGGAACNCDLAPLMMDPQL
ncbi:uncharacterized protein LOC143915563 [Arctopsyche grandis]|uniref:uncharacterized protein LOC143915563 n=1 Tax=Arctopsyche grandis TaxID=121162 RepID=UPI00406D83DF